MKFLLIIIINIGLINLSFSKDLTVAVIDTGIDLDHNLIKSKIWTNPGESGLDKNGMLKSKNGIDDDNNGYIDDYYGWNFASNNNDLTDNLKHGTHIAGIISKYTGVNVKIMPIKYFDKLSDTDLSKTDTVSLFVNSVKYAIDNGADIINFSGGGSGYNGKEYEIIKKARDKGIIIISAAGNNSANIDYESYYPASYNLDNIISVASFSKNAKLDSFSNYGKKSIFISAEGNDILSSVPGNKYEKLKGTSQATAIVTAYSLNLLANNYLSKNPKQYSFLKNKLLKNTKSVKGINKYIKTDKYISLNDLESNFKKSSISSTKKLTLNKIKNSLTLKN